MNRDLIAPGLRRWRGPSLKRRAPSAPDRAPSAGGGSWPARPTARGWHRRCVPARAPLLLPCSAGPAKRAASMVECPAPSPPVSTIVRWWPAALPPRASIRRGTLVVSSSASGHLAPSGAYPRCPPNRGTVSHTFRHQSGSYLTGCGNPGRPGIRPPARRSRGARVTKHPCSSGATLASWRNGLAERGDGLRLNQGAPGQPMTIRAAGRMRGCGNRRPWVVPDRRRTQDR